jgi:putative ABC transport system permease protein
MTFVLKMAMRETRAAWKRLLFFFLCVAIGVGAIVALRSVVQNVRQALAGEARSLIAADVLIRSNRPFERRLFDKLKVRLDSIGAVGRTDGIETATMARPADPSRAIARMVELRGVQREFPLYGDLTLEDGRPYSFALLDGRGTLVRRELLTGLGLDVGDRIVLGKDEFTIRGVIVNEPGSGFGAFSFGPRVLVSYDDLQRAGLLTFGSRARYEIMLRLPEPRVQPLVRDLRADLRDQFVSVRSFHNTEDNIGEDLERTENYLSLVGFVILILGGIGVWSVTRVFVRQKIRGVAVLKCLGASTAQVLGTYLAQIVLLATGGGLFGIALAAIAIAAIPERVTAALGDVSYGLTWSAALQGLGVGVLVSLLFSLVPLLEIRTVKPLLLLRHETAAPGTRAGSGRSRLRRLLGGLDPVSFGTGAAVSAALVALAAWQASSLRAGIFVCGGFAALAVLLHLAGLGLVRLVRPLTTSTWFPLRHAVMNLTRPGNQTRIILLAVGLGSFFIIGVRGLQASLLHELALDLRPESPDMFLIDIQGDQAAPLAAYFEGRGAGVRLIPVLRARVTGVRGSEVNLEGYQDVRGRGSLGREYVITYRDRLEANESLADGRLWTDSGESDPQVSIEESIRERFRINLGDTMRFDVLGRTISVRVSSVRRVDWDDARSGGFMFVFNPAALAAAPHGYIGILRGPADAGPRAALQRGLVDRFPNVSIIDVREVLRTVERVVSNVTLAITIVGLVALFSGALILVGAVAMTKFQRLYETAIFKTLGATTRTMTTMVVLEYGTLGALAGAIGSLGALGLSWALCRFVLEVAWRPPIVEHAGGLMMTAIVVMIVGVAASLDVLRRKPLKTLRAE